MQMASSGGRRLVAAALVAARHAPCAHPVTRKALAATARLAQEALSLRPSLRQVLGELVANWGEQAWERLLVWPSNERIGRRTGLSERAIRIALRDLMALGLVVARDSPNRKRYAIRNAAGTVVDAYGFDLTPLHARREEFVARVAAQKAERHRVKRAFDAITIARRGAEEAMAALRETYPEAWDPRIEAAFASLLARTPKRCVRMPSDELLEAWMALHRAVETCFLQAGNGGTTCRHIEDNKESSGEACSSRENADAPENDANGFSENEDASGRTSDDDVREVMRDGEAGRPRDRRTLQNLPQPGAFETGATPLQPMAIIEACPAAMQYGRTPRSTEEIIALGRYLRPMLGAGEIVWTEAELSLGPLRAALAVIFVTQLYDDDARRHGGESRIRNPGGYLRAFVRMVAAGRIDLVADLLAMRRRRLRGS